VAGCFFFFFGPLGRTEVDQLDGLGILIVEDVFQLEVSVEDGPLVKERYGVEELMEQFPSNIFLEYGFFSNMVKEVRLKILHDQEYSLVGLDNVETLDDVLLTFDELEHFHFGNELGLL